MNKIKENLEFIKKNKITGFMGHIVAGYPDMKSSLEAAAGICDGGTHFLEVQFPFSDPSADGPVIEGASYKAIDAGFTVAKGFELVKELTGRVKTGIIIMTYANIVYRYGVDNFIAKSLECGAGGLIVPDLPPECDEGIIKKCRDKGLSFITLVAPGDDESRIAEVSGYSDTFVYTVARRGTTGKKTDITDDTDLWLDKVKANSKVPIAVGFGIQSNDQVRRLKGRADIIVAGSCFVRTIDGCSGNYYDTLKRAAQDLWA